MLYQLPNGKTIDIPVEFYLDMTDEDLEYLIAFGAGEEINNPWAGSALLRKESSRDIDLPEVDEDPDLELDEE